jgi:hypothetical protein
VTPIRYENWHGFEKILQLIEETIVTGNDPKDKIASRQVLTILPKLRLSDPFDYDIARESEQK